MGGGSPPPVKGACSASKPLGFSVFGQSGSASRLTAIAHPALSPPMCPGPEWSGDQRHPERSPAPLIPPPQLMPIDATLPLVADVSAPLGRILPLAAPALQEAGCWLMRHMGEAQSDMDPDHEVDHRAGRRGAGRTSRFQSDAARSRLGGQKDACVRVSSLTSARKAIRCCDSSEATVRQTAEYRTGDAVARAMGEVTAQAPRKPARHLG